MKKGPELSTSEIPNISIQKDRDNRLRENETSYNLACPLQVN